MRPAVRGDAEPTTVHLVLSLEPGGAERLVADLSARVRGRRSVVVCLDARGELARTVERAGGRVELVRRRPGPDPGLVWRLARWLRTERPDVLHTHGLDPWLYGSLAATLAGPLARVHTQHNVPLGQPAGADRFKLRVAARLVQRIAAVSRPVDLALVARGVSPTRIRTIPNGVDLERFAPRADPPRGEKDRGALVVGSVARLAPEKGIDVLVDALARMRREGRAVRGRIAGDGPARDDLDARIRRSGLADDVELAGFQDDVPGFLAALDVFVLPSRTEGMPLALLEAMACGKPVVATDVGGVADVLGRDGECGVLVPPQDPAALGAALARLTDDPAERARLGAAARTAVERRFDLARTVRAYEALYDTVPRESFPAGLIKSGLRRALPRRAAIWRGRADGGQVALTFDDGPDATYTPRILDRLAEAGMRATFFLVGERAAGQPELFRRILDEGHEIGNHSHSHPRIDRLSLRGVRREIEAAQEQFARQGWLPVLWRPPRGRITPATLLAGWLKGMTVVLWSVDPRDYRAPDAERIRDRLRLEPPGPGDIVLYHGLGDASLAALPDLLDAVRGSGLRAVTVSQMLGR